MLEGASQDEKYFTVGFETGAARPIMKHPSVNPSPIYRHDAARGVNHTTAFSFPNIAYKSVYENALSALRGLSVDTSRFSSCKSSGRHLKL
jgi:hypothetical protein